MFLLPKDPSSVLENSSSLPLQEEPPLPSHVDVAIIGGGLIGLSIAWRLKYASPSLSVAVFNQGFSGGNATLAATGMLAAATELEPEGQALLALALESQKLWPQFCENLEQAADFSIDYRKSGTLAVALSRDEVERLHFRYHLHQKAGLSTTQWMTGADIRALEPGLRSSVMAGFFCPHDHQVDPRRVLVALHRALSQVQVSVFQACPVQALDQTGGAITGVQTGRGFCRSSFVVLAAGAWSSQASLLPAALSLPLRPFKGQALSLKATPYTPIPSKIIWTETLHLAPKADQRLIVGATLEDREFDTDITAGGVLALLEAARRALPSIEEMKLEAIWTGLRPTTEDDAPLLGPTSVPGFLLATGHHRNGVLLAPITAHLITDFILQGHMNEMGSRFTLERFKKQQGIKK